MAKFTDLYIKRPVLATVISLLILLIGARSLVELSIRQFPKIEKTTITVTTAYPGADAKLIQGFITSPLEKQIATAGGIDYLTSTSSDSVSTISAHITLNYSPSIAFTNIMSAVSEAQGELPQAAQKPIIKKDTGASTALMYLSFVNHSMTPQQLTDYISRVVQPKLETVAGVAQAQIMGGSVFAMRIWLNPMKMAALGVTAADVSDALRKNNFQSAAGSTKGAYTAITMSAKTDLQTVAGFKQLVIRHGKHDDLVRLQNVARVELGSETYDSSVYMNGKKAVFVAMSSTPEANPLTVISAVKSVLPGIERDYPSGMTSKVVYDATDFIRASIHEVIETILEATIIVILVIFLFLGSMRSVSIPIVTIPLSLIGVASLMLLLGYSYNLLTLLALVLAIGLVVDDAIVVVENIYRHIEEGMSAYDAAIKGAAEIATPVISMTITLAAVYAPIGFMGGLTGALFTEFAFTLAAAVIVSGVIALTLSPMMCAKVLTANISQGKLVQMIDRNFDTVKRGYSNMLRGILSTRSVVIFFAFVVFVSCAFLYLNTKKELAPTEDQGAVFVIGSGPQSANIHYIEKFTQQLNKIYSSYQSMENYFIINGAPFLNGTISAIVLKPWEQRTLSQAKVFKSLQKKLSAITGLRMMAFPLPSLPGGQSMPIQFEVTSTQPFSYIYPLVQNMLAKARQSGLFEYLSSDMQYDKPTANYIINRNKAAQLGVPMQNIAEALATSLGGGYVNQFSMGGRNYKVIPQLDDVYRLNPNQLDNLYVRSDNANLIPLSTVASLSYKTEPNALTHFQQQNAIMLQGMMMPGVSLDQALNYLQQQANITLPNGVNYDYAGQSRQYMKEGSALVFTFIFSIIIIFLVLAAQFESFRDPLVVMISVPMAICGALLPLNAGLATVNIYTQIGMITLIGLITKHGILMVEFSNKLISEKGLSRMVAIQQAAAIRLRPILMTTAAMIFGVLPLLLATGAGAVSRFDIGLVIASGMFIGTLFTLFVVPAMYTLKVSQLLLFIASVFAAVILIYRFLY